MFQVLLQLIMKITLDFLNEDKKKRFSVFLTLILNLTQVICTLNVLQGIQEHIKTV